MRFCTACGSPVSGILRFCTRCGAATSSTAGAEVASVAATGTADHSVPAGAAAPGPAPQDSPAPAAEAQPTGRPEDAAPLRLARIDAGPTHEASPEDPWLPGSRRPDRRALIIGVVLIAGLLSAASTAWLIRVNPPQASSPPGAHRSRPSQLGPGYAQPGQAQPGQALSGQPTPILTQRSQPAPGQLQPSQPAPTQTGNRPAAPGQAGHGQSGHDQRGRGQSDRGHPTGSGAPGSGASGTGHSGTGRGTTPTAAHPRPPAPHPRPPAPGSRGGRTPRHPHPGVVSITPRLGGRADARRVGGLLARYFAAVNHRQYQAYASLFAQRRQLTPRGFAWGYRTSHDSNAVLVGIAALKGGLRATVTFTSQQDPAQSPDHSSCIDWRITLFLYRAGAAYLIGMPSPGYRAGLQACSFAPRPSSPGHFTSRPSASRPPTSTRGPESRKDH
jgi:hypothetical protein